MDLRSQTGFRPALVLIALSVFAITIWAETTPEIPSGATIRIRMIDKLNSEENQVGDTFHATLEDPINVNGKDLYPKGADVTGKITDLHKSGRLSEPGELDLVLNTVTSGSMTSSLRVQPLVVKGESHTKSNAEKMGGGAALGAVIGALAGGGKGAAIGTLAGGAAGTGAAAATGKKAAVVASETVLSFTTVADANVAAATPPNSGPTSPNPDKSANLAPAADASPLFSMRDKRVISSCVAEHESEFPAGTTNMPELPPGSDRQLRRGDTLPADAQKAAQSLPLPCVQKLPALPSNMDRVVYSGRVLLIDGNNKILDVFNLDDTQ